MSAPAYYVGETACGFPLTVLDVIEAFDLPAHEAMAVKHVLRHGRKPNEPLIADLMKAIVYLQRKVDVLQAEAARAAMQAEGAEPAPPREVDVEIDEAGPIDPLQYARALRRATRERER